MSCTSSSGSAAGQPALATEGSWPSISQHSSAVYGANSDSMIVSGSAASRTAGSAAPGPVSIARRAALTSSISRATATFSRVPSTRLVTSSMVRWVTLRSSTSPPAADEPGAAPPAATSAATRTTRPRNFTSASGRMSAQSMSSSGGLAKIIVSRIASTPCVGQLLAQVDAVAQ